MRSDVLRHYSKGMHASTTHGQRRSWSLDSAVPRWLVTRPTTAAWWWIGAWAAVLLAAELYDWAIALRVGLICVAVAPALASMITVLLATPRRNLESHGSVFGHFFARYLAVIAAFLAWTASIVLGAAISTTLTLSAEGREDEVIGTGFSLVFGAILPAATILWIVFLLRCAWFLARVRGWRQIPAATTVPARLLLRTPQLRTVTIGVAHPGIVTATALVSGFALLSIELIDLTVWIDLS